MNSSDRIYSSRYDDDFYDNNLLSLRRRITNALNVDPERIGESLGRRCERIVIGILIQSNLFTNVQHTFQIGQSRREIDFQGNIGSNVYYIEIKYALRDGTYRASPTQTQTMRNYHRSFLMGSSDRALYLICQLHRGKMRCMFMEPS